MLFRQPDGTYIEIIKANYVNDIEYYKAIMRIKLNENKCKHLPKDNEDS